ncbi:helix-turn-helix transcriptional regulator [Arthrobacter glacialis]|uniref:helix-turn-helix transcriptional regulator n=1 Tax=Arthrobacter glacialis TaxID=1664 RepID=UPI0013FD4E88|nr:LuxR C-terminal-related transcriptional regulator [Arthrobacter glacialis]
MREPILETIQGRLLHRDSCGAILLGEYGVGKTCVAKQVLEVMEHDCLVVSLRCSASTVTIDYGALSPLMGSVAPDTIESPMSVLRAVSKELLQRASRRPIVLFIDNVQDLDDHSALIVSQLAVSKAVKLLLTGDSLTSIPGEILGLWRDGLISRMDVLPISEADARDWLEEFLDRPVSAAAANSLYEAGGGNPRFLSAVVVEQMGAGSVVLNEGVWVLSGAPFVCGRNSVDTVMAALLSLSVHERLVVEALALSGGLSIGQLMAFCDAKAVDSLQQRGFLTMGKKDGTLVHLRNNLVAQVLRQEVPAGRSRELQRLAAASADDQGAADMDNFQLAIWAIDCGNAEGLEHGHDQAREANNAGRPDLALRILDAMPGHGSDPLVLVESARAYLGLGNLDGARAVLFAPSLRLAELPLEQWVDVMLLRMAMASGGKTAAADAHDLHASISLRLHDERADYSATIVDLRERLQLAEIDLNLEKGRYAEVGPQLQLLHSTGASASTRRLAGLWLIEVWTLTGRALDAAKIADELELEAIVRDDAGPFEDLAGSALVTAITASLMAGNPGSYLLQAAQGPSNRMRSITLGQLVEGLMHAYSGRADKALRSLLAAASQFDQLDESASQALAYSAIAYSYALKGDDESAKTFMTLRNAMAVSGPRLTVLACESFEVLASAEIASREKAIVSLYSLADESHRGQVPALEMGFLCAAVRLGSSKGAPRLLDIAAQVQGPWARCCEGFAQGVMNSNAPHLLEMAEAASAYGDDLFARDIARAALKIASDGADKGSLRVAHQLIRNGVMKLGHVKVSSDDGQMLTFREQEIASLAARGASNKAIAAQMHISVRTVEGHLYQVYSKLQVNSRAELRESLA